MSALLTELTAILRDVLCDNNLDFQAGSRFDEIAGWDSMDLVSIVVEVECRFGLTFESKDIEQLDTVGDLMDAVVTKLARDAA